MGGRRGKDCFDDACEVKYRGRHLRGQPQYIVVQALWPKVVFTAIIALTRKFKRLRYHFYMCNKFLTLFMG